MAAFDGVSEVYDAARDIPPRVHGRIVGRVREEYGGKRIRGKHEFSLVTWSCRELLNLHPST